MPQTLNTALGMTLRCFGAILKNHTALKYGTSVAPTIQETQSMKFETHLSLVLTSASVASIPHKTKLKYCFLKTKTN